MENPQIYNFDNTKVHPKISTRIYKLFAKPMYQICNYDNEYICIDESKCVTQCRSVIKSHPSGQLLSFSLPRKSTLNTVVQTIHGIPPQLFINEFIEGPMIHLFYDPCITSWEIATKNAVGGHYPLDKDVVNPGRKCDSYIRTIFCNAFASESLHTIPCLEYLSKQYSYHFVLQLETCRPYLVGVYEIQYLNNRAIYKPQTSYMHWVCFQNTPVMFPQVAECNLSINLDESYLEDFCIERELDGVVLHNTHTASHYVHKSMRLKEKHATSRMDAAMFFRFLSLKQAGLENGYLEQHPNHIKRFRKFHTLYHNTVTSIYNHYSAFYIRKMVDVIGLKYKYYVDELHRRYYLPSLAKKERRPVTKRIVYEYFATLSPSQQLYACFYEQRERKPHPST